MILEGPVDSTPSVSGAPDTGTRASGSPLPWVAVALSFALAISGMLYLFIRRRVDA
jgi:hypothetical protein